MLLANLIIVFVRERYRLEGCVLCLDQEVDRISALMQKQKDDFVESQIRNGMLVNETESLLKQAASHFIGNCIDVVAVFYEEYVI